MENKFTEEDKKRVVEFLNIMAEKADFSHLKLADVIKIFKSLSYMQTELIPKINANILEVVALHEVEPEKKPTIKRTPTKGKK